MGFFKNLEEIFEDQESNVYSTSRYPYKPQGSELHPIRTVAPNDPNRAQGSSFYGNRLVPVERVLEDQERMTTWLTSSRGLLFFVGQNLLQTGNSISETRLLNPLWINLNLSPNIHVQRSLQDQQDFPILDPARSPASTPLIGYAGRLQIETAAQATSRITNSPNARQSLFQILGATQIAGTLTAFGQAVSQVFGGPIGTLGVNQRPELNVAGRYYSVMLREGYTPTAARINNLVANIFSVAGAISAVVGFFDFAAGVIPRNLAPTIDRADDMRYFITGPDTAIRYIAANQYSIVPRPPLYAPTSQLVAEGPIGSPLPISATSDIVYIAPSDIQLFSPVHVPRADAPMNTRLTFPESSLESRYSTDERMEFIRRGLSEQAKSFGRMLDEDTARLNRGIFGGFTLAQLESMQERTERGGSPLPSEQDFLTMVRSFPRRQIGLNTDVRLPSYYFDELNTIVSVESIDQPDLPTDFIRFFIEDAVNGRIVPFRAMVSNITETSLPNYSDNQYVGRIERNIVYQGVTRNVQFTLNMHAFSPEELEGIWSKINFLTGLSFPSQISPDGYMVPPLARLTLGDLYEEQPGYLSSLTHTIGEQESWEIDEDAQVPMGIEVAMTFEIIEKFTMRSTSAFYNFGTPITG